MIISIEIPDNLLIASAAVVSGKSPNASESTIETILSLSLCLSIAAIKLASLIAAIDKQRESDKIVSIVDSDALGDFPDTTAAEAIRRLSGISIEMIKVKVDMFPLGG